MISNRLARVWLCCDRRAIIWNSTGSRRPSVSEIAKFNYSSVGVCGFTVAFNVGVAGLFDVLKNLRKTRETEITKLF